MTALKNFMASILLAAFLCVSCAAPLNADGKLAVRSAPLPENFLMWQNMASSDRTSGYIPDPLDLSHLKDNPPSALSRISSNVGEGSYPASYDLRNKGRLSVIRDQGIYATCWAYASLGSMESNYMTRSMTSLGTSPDLSELHMAWFVYKDPDTGHSFTAINGADGNNILSLGGNAAKSIAYLSRFSGPVNELSLPYTKASSISSEAENKRPSDYSPVVLMLRDAYILGDITAGNRETVKKLIIENGAVQASYYSGQVISGGAYYNGNGYSTYYDSSSGIITDHAILLVGWDDNFSRDNFNSDDRPSSNGAWLVRDSRGTSSPVSDNGYFWMSYSQYITGGASYIVGEYDSNTGYYGHDDLGQSGVIGWRNEGAILPGWAANVFKARGDERIKSVAFYTTDNNAQYEVYIFSDLGTSKPSSPVSGDNPAPLVSGTQPYAGYHVVDLPSPVQIRDGHYFSVIVKLTNPSYQYSIARESKIEGYSDNAVINPGESYIAQGQAGGGFPSVNSWNDGATIELSRGEISGEQEALSADQTRIISPMNACIKAFTSPVSEVPEGFKIDDTLFPDTRFLEYARTFDTDSNNYLKTSEIQAVTSMDLSGKGITDLTGIKIFTALISLDISGNSITSLDISGMSALRSLTLGNNNNLASLKVTGTAITSLNVSGCPKLKSDKITKGSGVTVTGLPPEFTTNSLNLSGTIGVNFYVYIPPEISLTDCVMSFDIRGEKSTPPQPYDSSFYYDDEDTGRRYYGFRCRINSAQMADPITAIFTYGEGKTISKDYSVKDYLNKGLSIEPDGSTAKTMLTKIGDFGHYVQPFLSSSDGWTIGSKYLLMPKLSDTEYTSEDINSIKRSEELLPISVVSSDDCGIEMVNFNLVLGSETTIKIYLKANNSFRGTVTASVDNGSTYSLTKLSDGEHSGEYLAEVNDIPAHKLGTAHSIRISAGGTLNIRVSAMSYVHKILNSNTSSLDEKKAAVSLYWYFKSAEDYANTLSR